MSQVFFIILLILFTIIRIPLSFIVIILRPIVPFFKKRLNFERKNLIDEASLKKINADFCFEISSEGELEQSKSLIEACLLNHKKIEIIYSSPSVENKCLNLYKSHPEQVRLLRMPLLSGSPLSFLYFQSVWSWVSAPVVIFCRYDFYPDLLLLKLFKKKFVLISGAFKKTSWYKLESFKFFDVIIAATDAEKNNFQNLLGNSAEYFSCDFRIPRITDRYQHASETLAEKKSLQSYLGFINSLTPSEKIILGSAWKSDLLIFNNPKLVEDVKSGKLNILISPHKLDKDFVDGLEAACISYFGKENVEVVNEASSWQKRPVVILQMSGILCELYSLFRISYVGGGYERSIHSVLEPFFSDNIVVTGPAIGRSTEFDLAFDLLPGEIHVLNNPESFYTIIKSNDLTRLDKETRIKFRTKTQLEMKLIISEILN